MRIFCPAMVVLSAGFVPGSLLRSSLLRGKLSNGAACLKERRPGLHPGRRPSLLQDLGDAPCTYRATTLADGETQALFHGDRLDQLNRHLGVVARHDHLGALRQVDAAGDVSGAEVELRAVVVEERGVPAAFVLG